MSDTAYVVLAAIAAPIALAFIVAMLRGYNFHLFFWRPDKNSHEFLFGPKHTVRNSDERNEHRNPSSAGDDD